MRRCWCSKHAAQPHADRAKNMCRFGVLDLMIHDIDSGASEASRPRLRGGRLAAVGCSSAEGPIDYVNASLGFDNGWWPSLDGQQDGSPQDPQPQRPTAGPAVWKPDFLNRSLHIHRRTTKRFVLRPRRSPLPQRRLHRRGEAPPRSNPSMPSGALPAMPLRAARIPAVNGQQPPAALLGWGQLDRGQAVDQPSLCMTLGRPESERGLIRFPW